MLSKKPLMSRQSGEGHPGRDSKLDLHLRGDKQIEGLSRMFNPVIRGWLLYYGRFYRSALYPPMRQLDRSLARWAERKYKKLRGHLRRHIGSRVSRDAIRSCGRTSRWECGVAPWREPYELRGSRTVRREARGEIPRAYSPCGGLSEPNRSGAIPE
jgi:hypothetical protein